MYYFEGCMHTYLECCVLNLKTLLSLEDKALGRSSCSPSGVWVGDDTAVPIMARQASSRKTGIASVSPGTALFERLMNYPITLICRSSAAKTLVLKLQRTRYLGLTPVLLIIHSNSILYCLPILAVLTPLT